VNHSDPENASDRVNHSDPENASDRADHSDPEKKDPDPEAAAGGTLQGV